LYDTYGEGDKRSKILYNLLTPNKVGLENKIRNPEAIINWTHAIDVARGIRKVVELSLSLEDVKFSTHQIRSKDEYKLREIANLLESPDFENLDRQLESSRVRAIWNCAEPLSDEIFSETLVDFIRRNYNWYT